MRFNRIVYAYKKDVSFLTRPQHVGADAYIVILLLLMAGICLMQDTACTSHYVKELHLLKQLYL